MKARKRRGANIRVVGTKAEICGILATFKSEGFTWRSNEHLYPRIGQPDFYSYYLEDFECPLAPWQSSGPHKQLKSKDD